MSSDVILFCEQLKLAVGNQDTKQASIYLDGIDQYFNDRISENEIGECFTLSFLVIIQFSTKFIDDNF